MAQDEDTRTRIFIPVFTRFANLHINSRTHIHEKDRVEQHTHTQTRVQTEFCWKQSNGPNLDKRRLVVIVPVIVCKTNKGLVYPMWTWLETKQDLQTNHPLLQLQVQLLLL